MIRGKRARFTFDPTGGCTDPQHPRTVSDSNKMGEAAPLRGGFGLLLLFGDELSLLQRQIHLLLRVVVVELADVGDQGPGKGTGSSFSPEPQPCRPPQRITRTSPPAQPAPSPPAGTGAGACTRHSTGHLSCCSKAEEVNDFLPEPLLQTPTPSHRLLRRGPGRKPKRLVPRPALETYLGSGSSGMWSIRTSCLIRKRQRC